MVESRAISETWLLLLPQLPAKPSYFRVKIWRRLQGLGAVGLKNAAYVLPATDEAREDFEWLRREIEQGGGEATICEARFIDGRTDADVVAAFNSARENDYRELAEQIAGEKERPAGHDRQVHVWEARYRKIVAIDFFGAPGREIVDALMRQLKGADASPNRADSAMQQVSRTWVTRRDVKIDRIASAWLISRFIDRHAVFKFVEGRGYVPQAGEIRFDMFEGEHTHRGERCTFEVLIEDFSLNDPALAPIAEIVHDLDLKDERYGRAETIGVAAMLQGLVTATSDDMERLRRGGELFDSLLATFGAASR